MKAKRARERDETRLAALVYLSRALSDLSLPTQIAEEWIRPGDLPGFVEELEKRVRALAGLIDGYLKKHSVVLQQDDDRGTAWVLECQLDGVHKNLDFLNRIGKRGTKKDAGKSNPEIVREEVRRAIAGSAPDFSADAEKVAGCGSAPDFSADAEKVAGCGSAPDFSAEAEELRKLRAGELKINLPPKEPQP